MSGETSRSRRAANRNRDSLSDSDNENHSVSETEPENRESTLTRSYSKLMDQVFDAMENRTNYSKLIPKFYLHLSKQQYVVFKDIALGNKKSSDLDEKIMETLLDLPNMASLLFELESKVKEGRFNNENMSLKTPKFKDLILNNWNSMKGSSPTTFLQKFVDELRAQDVLDETVYGRFLYLSCDEDAKSVLKTLSPTQKRDWNLVKKVFTEHYAVEDFIYFNIKLITDKPQDHNVNNVVTNMVTFISAVHELEIDVNSPHIFVNALMLRRIPDEVRKDVLTVMQARRQTIDQIQIQKLRKLIVTKAREILKESHVNNSNRNNHLNNNTSHNKNRNDKIEKTVTENESSIKKDKKPKNNYDVKVNASKGSCFKCGAPEYSKTHKCEVDKNGMILLSSDYVKSAGLTVK